MADDTSLLLCVNSVSNPWEKTKPHIYMLMCQLMPTLQLLRSVRANVNCGPLFSCSDISLSQLSNKTTLKPKSPNKQTKSVCVGECEAMLM